MRRTCLSLLACLLLTGCLVPAYFMSPFNSNSHAYHAIPMHADSVKATTYAGATFTAGGANHDEVDGLYAFSGSLHRAHNFGHWQASYGGDITLGHYNVATYHRDDGAGSFSLPHSVHSFGGYGFSGGMAYVISYRQERSEVRLGIETSFTRETGDLLRYRKALPPQYIDILERSDWTKTVGGYFDFVDKDRHSGEIGFKLAWGRSLCSSDNTYLDGGGRTPWYFSPTVHLTKKPVVYFAQLNFGQHVGGGQLGVNYRLGRKQGKND